MIYSLHADDFRESLPIRLQLFSINFLQPGVNRPDGVPYYQWFCCVKGQGELLINRQRYLISPGQGFFICSNDAHSYRPINPGWTLHIFGFSGPLCPELLKHLQMYESGAFQFSDIHLFESHITQLLHLYKSSAPERTLACSKECYSFLLDLSRNISHSSSAGYAQENKMAVTIISYLEHNYQNPVTLYDLSEIVNLSRDYMCALFKKETGQTIMQYLIEIRIGHARHFLTLYPEKRASEIGKMCGFESPSYFGKVFRKEVGISPEQYRKTKKTGAP